MVKPLENQPHSTDDNLAAILLLKEADEAIRQDRLKALWQEWGSTIIGVALMIIFGTMIGVGWQSWRGSVQSAQTAALIQSQTKDGADASASLSGSYAGLAALLQAAQLSSAGTAMAPAVNDKLAVAADSGLPREWDILAQWGAYRTKVDATTDKDALLALADDMVELANERNNPYTPMMLMEAAIIKGENGDTLQATSLLNDALNNPLTEKIPSLNTEIKNLLPLYQAESK